MPVEDYPPEWTVARNGAIVGAYVGSLDIIQALPSLPLVWGSQSMDASYQWRPEVECK